MKRIKTFALAATILAITLSVFPHRAAADSTSAPSAPGSQVARAGGDKPVKYMAVVLAVEILSSVLVA